MRSYRRTGPWPFSPAGSISACAELPKTFGFLLAASRVYLRVCGVTEKFRRQELGGEGLSPRVRSYQGEVRFERKTRGSISACAELPTSLSLRYHETWVYLRVCGVTDFPWPVRAAITGLSPRVRSYLTEVVGTVSNVGSISACAELPAPRKMRRGPPRVYLRVCGVTDRLYQPVGGVVGLSPRVRSYPCYNMSQTDWEKCK